MITVGNICETMFPTGVFTHHRDSRASTHGELANIGYREVTT